MGPISKATESGFPFTIFPSRSHHIMPCYKRFIIHYRLSPLSLTLLRSSDHLPTVDIIPTTYFTSDHAVPIPDIVYGSHDHVHTLHLNLDIYEKFKQVDLMLIEFNYTS